MLPPDTSSGVLPWRVMVPLIQVCGCFPYKMSATSGPPMFSLPLCLWGVFIQLLVAALNCAVFREVFLRSKIADIGNAAYLYTILSTLVTLSLAPVVLAVKSDMLATLLHDLSEIKDLSPPPTSRWYCKKKTLALLLSVILHTIVHLRYISVKVAFSKITAVVLFTPVVLLCDVYIVLPTELASMVFDLLAHRLLVATEATVAVVSSLLSPDGSFKCDSDAEVAMVALRDLEAVIRKVEMQREKGTRCFFPIITIFLLTGVLLAIASPYAIRHGLVMGGTIFIAAVIGYGIMARFCQLGQSFVSQVSTSEGNLKDLKIKIQNPVFSMKVSQVMGSLSPLLTFDMCGWYTLSYSSFIGMVNTVITYIVIIFQLGGSNGME